MTLPDKVIPDKRTKPDVRDLLRFCYYDFLQPCCKGCQRDWYRMTHLFKVGQTYLSL